MYIFKNAWTSITRNKGRNALIGIIILVISCSVAVTLAIKNSAATLISAYEEKYDITASLGFNRESMMKNFNPENKEESKDKMMENYSKVSEITIEDIESYGNSNYVKNYYYTMSIGANSTDIEKVSMDAPSINSGRDIQSNIPKERPEFNNQTSGDFTIVGYSSYDAMSEFMNGNYSIIDGEVSSDFKSMNCVISNELATLNNIKVGDSITFIDANNNELTYIFTVTGIYEEKTNDTNMMNMFSNSSNKIITNSKVVKTISDANSELSVATTPSFVLKNKEDIENFQNELYEKGMSESLKVTTNIDEVEGATSTISNVSNFATTFLVITLIIGIVVLFIINMINIRERKYEIGVLRTIGMKKLLLTMQFMLELLIVTITSLLIGTGIGATISVPISNNLLKNEIEAASTENNDISKNFGNGVKSDIPNNKNQEMNKFNGTVTLQAYDSIDAVVDFKVLLEVLGIGILLTLISSTASMISIQKFSPLTILKERS